MQAKDVTDAAFAGLQEDEEGWYLTEPGLKNLEATLEASIDAGNFSSCSVEMAALVGFLSQRGDARRALGQLKNLGVKFYSRLTTLTISRREAAHKTSRQTAALLGVSMNSRARRHDAPREGLSLSEVAPIDALFDLREIRPKRTKA